MHRPSNAASSSQMAFARRPSPTASFGFSSSLCRLRASSSRSLLGDPATSRQRSRLSNVTGPAEAGHYRSAICACSGFDVHTFWYNVHPVTRWSVTTTTIRHKHLRIDQAKLDKARKILAVKTDTETLDRALALVVSEAEIDAALRRVAGKGRLKKVFR